MSSFVRECHLIRGMDRVKNVWNVYEGYFIIMEKDRDKCFCTCDCIKKKLLYVNSYVTNTLISAFFLLSVKKYDTV